MPEVAITVMLQINSDDYGAVIIIIIIIIIMFNTVVA